jgi:hypothetical protein
MKMRGAARVALLFVYAGQLRAVASPSSISVMFRANRNHALHMSTSNAVVEHIHADQFDCALQACSEAIRLDSRLSTAYACRGGVLSNQGEFLRH